MDVLVADSRRRGIPKLPPIPTPAQLAAPPLPPRAVANVLEVTDFLKLHATALRMPPFHPTHLLSALGLENGSLGEELMVPPTPVPHKRGQSSDSGAPPFFLQRSILLFMRVLFGRDGATGEAFQIFGNQLGPFNGAWDRPEGPLGHRWDKVRMVWGELLNPLTLGELTRRYLSALQEEPGGPWAVDLFTEPYGFCPFGESFHSLNGTLTEAAEALQSKSLEDLEPEQILALMRILCEELQDTRTIQDFIQSKLEVGNGLLFCLHLSEDEG